MRSTRFSIPNSVGHYAVFDDAVDPYHVIFDVHFVWPLGQQVDVIERIVAGRLALRHPLGRLGEG
jgi:hypothetical protein